ncbi:AraC family transcriptional regulator [Gammaproteobacteria bacterium MFB021]|nr:AraC family transcriptional regulator [Gammaproteobacteria bacterium MFB021]
MAEAEGRRTSDWLIASPASRLERIEARFQGHAYDMHRHDSFAIGLTLNGVQSFHYRRGYRHSLPGTVLVLHPDEPHDGHAGDARGFHYRMLYIDPALIQSALGGQPLPFVAGGLCREPRLATAVQTLLASLDGALDPLEESDGIAELADALAANGDARRSAPKRLPDYRAAQRVRERLDAALLDGVSLDELEAIAGQPRWTLSRDFRALFGTSPYRYLTQRRLALARQQIAVGTGLAEAAHAAGFADQSHMTRAFGRTYGLSPARWRGLLGTR